MNKKIAIIFLGDFFFDARCINMAKSLLLANNEVTIICTYNEFVDNKNFDDIKFHNIKLQKTGLRKYIEFHNSVVQLLKHEKIDIIIAGDLYALSSATKFKDAHIIYDCREIYTELAAHQSKPLYKKVSYWYEKYFLKYVNTILTTADSDEKLLKQKYQNFKHLDWHKIYNYPIHHSNSTKYNIKEKLNIPMNHTTIIYQGVIQKYRGINQLIKLVSSTNNITGIIIGDGEEKNHYVQQARSLQVLDKIKFISKVPYLELLNYTATCDIGWLVIEGHGISNQLAMPNKLFEYTLMGLPVISSPLKNMKNIVEKYNLGVVVDEQNCQEQINAVKHIINHKKQYDHIQQTIQQKFTWEIQHEKFINLINGK